MKLLQNLSKVFTKIQDLIDKSNLNESGKRRVLDQVCFHVKDFSENSGYSLIHFTKEIIKEEE